MIFSRFTKKLKEKASGLLGGGGGGAKGYVGPPSQIIGGPGPPFLRLCKRQTKIAADDILIFYFYLWKKIRLAISSESSA